MEPDGLIDLLVQFPAACDVVRSEPTSQSVVLEVRMEPVREFLV